MPERRIQILPDVVASQIAAGEVVDRPASVLKELMENALDAGARRLDVELQGGGAKRLAVADDGCGMGRDDALLSVERYATSKIRTADDLARIATLGFRGEALAASASVSRFRLVTRTADMPAGTEVILSGGKLVEVREAGAPAGTLVEVRDLFFNVPARRRFLRSPETEGGHARIVFLAQALGHPETAMTLKAEGRPVYSLTGGATLGERIRDVFGRDYAARLRPVAHESGGVRVTGFAGVPAAARPDRTEQYVYVNGRAATAAVIARGLREGYHTLVPSDRHPVAFLFLEMPPEQVDVNVHPNKREVRFRNPAAVRDAVAAALRRALAADGGAAAAQPPADGALGFHAAGLPPLPEALPIADLPPARTFRYPRLPMGPPAPAVPGEPAGAPPPASPWTWCRVLGQAGSLYVVLETDEGLVLLDPHAAHERVMFERLMKAAAAGRVESQGLLTPESVTLPPAAAAACRRHLDILRKVGFGISEFGGDALAVDAMPALFAGASAARILPELAAELEEGSGRADRVRWSEESIVRAACKSAVKQRDRLTLAEIERLVTDLAAAEMPYTCPHGRPTMIFMSYGELNRRFGRT